jgi:PAS domain S-box-containing protein
MDDPSIYMNSSSEERNTLHQRLLELERFNCQCQEQVEQLTQQLIQERTARQQAEERFQLAAKAVESVIYDWNLEIDRIDRTDGLTRLLGYSLAETEPTGKWWRDRIHPDDLQPILEQALAQLTKDDYFTAEYRILNKLNQYIYVLDRGLVVARDVHGQPIRIVGSTTNISEQHAALRERRQAQLQLQESQRFVQQIADALPGTLYIYDILEHRNLYVNRQIGELLGYTPAQIQAFGDQLFAQLIHPEDFANLSTQIERLNQAKDGEIVDYEYRMRHANGEWRWLWSRNTVSTRTAEGEAHQIVGTVHDITARKQFEEELRESEQRLKLAQQAGKIGTWEWNLLTNEVTWSDGIWKLLALEPNSITLNLESFTVFIHPDDREQAIKSVEILLAQGDEYQDEFRVIRQDGVTRWFLSKGKVSRTEDGRPERLLGINVDITDRKRAEAALAESNQTLQAIVQACPLAIMGLRADGTVQIWNPAAERIFGWSQQEVLGKFLPAIPENKRDEFLNNLALTIQGQGLVSVEAQRQKKGNVLFDVELWSAPVDETQAGISCLSVVADISERKSIEQERKQAEESLRQSEERYRYLAESIPQLVWTADAQGVLIDVNQRWSTFTGLNLEQVQTVGWVAVVHPDDLTILGDNWAIAQQNGTYYQAEGRIRRADGVYRWHLHQAIPLKNEQSQAIKWFGTATDIEDQKQLEQQRIHLLQQEQIAREQAETANRIKDEFLAVLSHELRTPLNPILGWAKLLRTCELDAKKIDRALETIERNAELQAQLIEDLLDISRILQGKLALNACPVNLVNAIEAALETVQLSAQAKGIQIQTVLNAKGIQVKGDANRLQQIVWNLLSNAVKFSTSGGCVEVRLEQIETYAQIQVKDHGQGISPDFLPHVFEYFRQADSSTTRQFGGLGLGLAIVHHLVELHGGTVTGESPGIGMGTTFTVRLPLMSDRYTENAEPPSLKTNLNLNEIEILVVDDDTDNRDFIAFVLEEAGAKILTATSAIEALKILKQSPPDLLLADIGMPEMDGYMLIRQVRALPLEQGGKILAIALTAFAGEMNQQQALAAGFQKHIAKPIEPEELIKAIIELAKSSQ